MDWRADIYALGVTLYEMLLGHAPFEDSGGGAWSVVLKHVLASPPPLVGRRVDMTSEIEAVVMKALAKEPRKRYRSAGEMALAFRRAIAGGRVLALPAKSVVTVPVPAVKGGADQRSGKEAERVCPACGTVNRPAAKFCMRDGTRLAPLRIEDVVTVKMEEYILACPTCGFVNRSGARFCAQDGTLLYKRVC